MEELKLFNRDVGEDLRVPCIARRSNQSILKEISSEYSFEGLMLKLQIFSHLRGTDSLEKSWCWERLKVGEGDDRGWDGWMAPLTWWTWIWASSGNWWWTGKSVMLQPMGLQRVRHDLVTEQQLINQIINVWTCQNFNFFPFLANLHYSLSPYCLVLWTFSFLFYPSHYCWNECIVLN